VRKVSTTNSFLSLKTVNKTADMLLVCCKYEGVTSRKQRGLFNEYDSFKLLVQSLWLSSQTSGNLRALRVGGEKNERFIQWQERQSQSDVRPQ
jgi:hypothetical protein